MPMIIDANRSADFSVPVSGRAREILQGIATRKIRIVAGGKLLQELSRTKLRSFLTEWARVGLLMRIDAAAIDAEIHNIGVLPVTSDDAHVLAIARVSRTQLLYTDDGLLITDFKNIQIIWPRGKVIKSTTDGRIALSLIRQFAA